MKKSSVTKLNSEFYGSFLNKKAVTFTQAIQTNIHIKRTKTLSTFVPDEIIFSSEPTKKVLRRFTGILLLVDISDLLKLREFFTGGENGGSFGFTNVLNFYISVIIEHINYYGGDILKFTTDGILVLWKVGPNVLIFHLVQKVILCALGVHDTLKSASAKTYLSIKVKTAISTGHVVFSVIGNENTRHFVIAGEPVTKVKFSKNVGDPGDLILAASAWEHCSPSDYQYVIKDENNIQVNKIITKLDWKEKNFFVSEATSKNKPNSPVSHTANSRRPSILTENSFSQFVTNFGHLENNYQKSFIERLAISNAVQRSIGNMIKLFVAKPVLNQIEKDQTLDNLTEIKRVTVVSVNIFPKKCSIFELISLIDKCYIQILSIVKEDNGTVNVTVSGKYTIFEIIFGSIESEKNHTNAARIGIIHACKILNFFKTIPFIHEVRIGVSTDTAFCSVIGHVARRYFAVIGSSLEECAQIAFLSKHKISCDTNTLMYSNMPKKLFRPRGLQEINKTKKIFLHYYVGDQDGLVIREKHGLSLVYPILGRFAEMEIFSEILDDMNVQDRKFSGILIQNKILKYNLNSKNQSNLNLNLPPKSSNQERNRHRVIDVALPGTSGVGKSRLLDAYVVIAKSRQIRCIEVDLHYTFSSKENAVIFHILEQIFQFEDCKSIDQREKILIKVLCNVISHTDFCYVNNLMRVRFPFSKTYCLETDLERHSKRVIIINELLKRSKERLCIFLDNVQYLDQLSCQYLNQIMKHSHIVLAMTMISSNHSKDTTFETNTLTEKKLKKHVLGSLPFGFITSLACQFLNVCAIPQELERILLNYGDHNPEWCKLFLTLILQSNGLTFINLTPKQVKQHKLVFPDNILVSKIHSDLLAEEVVPLKTWKNMDKLSVCLINNLFTGYKDSLLNTNEMEIQIFERMHQNEQIVIKCASFIGDVFSRQILMMFLERLTSQNTVKVVESMIRIRVLECASIRRPELSSKDMTFCSFKKTHFADVHHLIQCRCSHSELFSPSNIPLYAYCKFLEFKSTAFRKTICGLLSEEQKTKLSKKMVEILGKEFRKCEACGEGQFLKIHDPEQLNTRQYRTMQPAILKNKKSTRNSDKSKKRFKTRRMSLISEQDSNESDASMSQDLYSPVANADITVTSFWKFFRGLKKQNSILPRNQYEFLRLKKISHIDYRNCRCNYIINSVLWKYPIHLDEINTNSPSLITFLMQYSAALIENAESSYAIQILTIAYDKNEIQIVKSETIFDKQETLDIKASILCLKGTAYTCLGRYNLAKKYYMEALSLCNYEFSQRKVFSKCNLILLKIVGQTFFDRITFSSKAKISKSLLKFAQVVRLLSVASLMEETQNSSQQVYNDALNDELISINSWNFHEKCQLFLSMANNCQKLGKYKLLRNLIEKMLLMICQKKSWRVVEELFTLANVFRLIIKIYSLQGNFSKAVSVGSKLLRLANILHLNKIKICSLPLIIECMIRLKRINETVDLMHELYYISSSDTDESAITWYYALSMDLILDAGITLESYQTCLSFADQLIATKKDSCVTRDPESKQRLIVSLQIWQLRIGNVTHSFLPLSMRSYLNLIEIGSFSQIVTVCKIWEMDDYNNMSQYWVEYVANENGVDWKDVHNLSIEDWSTILYSLPMLDIQDF